jgi:hypothetical protein
MTTVTEVTLETLLVSAINVMAVYLAAFTYRLSWVGVLTVMVLVSLFTATITHVIITKIAAAKKGAETLISEGLGVMGVAIVSSIAVLVILSQRFNFAQALGISIVSGMLSSFIRHLLRLA